MTNSRWRIVAYIGAGLCCYVFFLLITLPAYWADWLLNRASHGLIRVQQTEGTLWNGAGNFVIQSTGQERLRARLAWDLQLLRLLTGQLSIHLSTRDSRTPVNATIRLGYRQMSAHDVDATLPIGVLSAFIPAIELVAPSGRLNVTATETTLTPDKLEGDLKLNWLGAGAKMGGLNEIGDYRLHVNGRGATAELRVETIRGDIIVAAQGEWRLQGEGLMQLTGTLTPGNREDSLRPLLTMINAQNNNGQYSWMMTRRMPASLFFGVAPAP